MQKADTLIRTKLHLPFTRSELVPRPRLQVRIAEGLRGPLTLITAPAGFGKTTLVASCIAGCETPVAWLSLDKNDNQIGRFLSYLIAAMQEADHSIGSEAAQLWAASQQAPSVTVLTSLINDLDATGSDIVLVLDDYQFISNQAVHEVVTFLLEHCPKAFHLVIATRSDPPLPLARLRARGQTVVLRADDLSFMEPEAAQFLNEVMGLHLDSGSIAVLAERTEGWIAGLQMAALSMRDREDVSGFIDGFSGTNRYILDYLMEEVLASQSPEIQRFLLFTSILERLTAPLCDAVLFDDEGMMGEGDDRSSQAAPDHHSESPFIQKSAAILEYLERANLFLVPLDDDRIWYRYHHLFAELLQSRLSQSSAKRVNVLHLKASQWFEDQGLFNEAVEHALLSKDFHRSANLIDTSSQTRVLIDVFTVQKWIQQIPEEVIREHPWISVTQSWIWLTIGKLENIEECLERAENCIRGDNNRAFDAIEIKNIRGHIAMIRAYVAFFHGSPEVTIEQASLALQNVHPSNHYLHSRIALQLGESYFVLGELKTANRYLQDAISLSTQDFDYSVATVAYFRLGSLLKIQGELIKAEQLYQQNLQALKDMGGYEGPMLGKPEVGLGDLLRERGQLDAAQELLSAGHKHSIQQGQPYDLVFSYIYQARLYEALGRVEQALEMLSQAEPLFLAYTNPPVVRVGFECYRVCLWLRLGKLNQAEQWVAENQLDPDLDISYATEQKLTTLARVLIAQGRFIEAQGLLYRLASGTEAGGRKGKLIEILVLLALALQATNNMEQALEILSKSLTLAKPEGYIRIFIDEGEPIRMLLAKELVNAGAGPMRDYVIHLLSHFDYEAHVVATAEIKASPTGNLIEPLSPRELEVLHYIALGKTNQEIARQLVVSPGTIKAHTASIYRKLEVANRTEAVARARQLGVLP